MANNAAPGAGGVYPPPPPYTAYQPQVQAQPIIVQPGMVTTVMIPATQPTAMTCNSCHATIVTRVTFTPSVRTHLLALLLCVVGCWPCACVPYCVDSCNNINHHCPSCGAYLGSYSN